MNSRQQESTTLCNQPEAIAPGQATASNQTEQELIWINQFLVDFDHPENPDNADLADTEMPVDPMIGLNAQPYLYPEEPTEEESVRASEMVEAVSHQANESRHRQNPANLKNLPLYRYAGYIAIVGKKQPPYFEDSLCYYFIENIVKKEKTATGQIWNELLRVQDVSTGFTYQEWWSDTLNFPGTEKIPSFIPFPEILAIFERALAEGSPAVTEKLWLNNKRLRDWCAEKDNTLLTNDKYGLLEERSLSCLSVLHRALANRSNFFQALWEASPFLREVWSTDRNISVEQRIALLQTASRQHNQKSLFVLLEPLLQFINHLDEDPVEGQSARLLVEITKTFKDPQMKRNKKTTFAYTFFKNFLHKLENREVISRSIKTLEESSAKNSTECQMRIEQLKKRLSGLSPIRAKQAPNPRAICPAKRACPSDEKTIPTREISFLDIFKKGLSLRTNGKYKSGDDATGSLNQILFIDTIVDTKHSYLDWWREEGVTLRWKNEAKLHANSTLPEEIPFSEKILIFKQALRSERHGLINMLWKENKKLQVWWSAKPDDSVMLDEPEQSATFLEERVSLFELALSTRCTYIVSQLWETSESLRDWWCKSPINPERRIEFCNAIRVIPTIKNPHLIPLVKPIIDEINGPDTDHARKLFEGIIASEYLFANYFLKNYLADLQNISVIESVTTTLEKLITEMKSQKSQTQLDQNKIKRLEARLEILSQRANLIKQQQLDVQQAPTMTVTPAPQQTTSAYYGYGYSMFESSCTNTNETAAQDEQLRRGFDFNPKV